ncbi:uncharacterized protein LOC116307241 isoform X2 [Actinia tenebrosa]|uniref:Uncharacterized protein LOC116307241 isoform X2 n=1 Tax=Actinia tenebrosa TaxID=6105 RepID=A0A6P8J5T0_ACTTE|nr:uncharacterized protein LOC116307241 isoform X2 [Actinia tenebrosa]
MTSLNLEGSPGRKVMYMYITLQPCHESITHDRKKSCTEILIEFYEKKIKGSGIHFIVKPTFIYKAYWSPTEEEIINAKEGLRKLIFKEGIQVQAMEKEDWTFLKNHLCPSIELFPDSTYEESERKKLDKFIDGFLKSKEIGSDPPSSDSDPPSSGSDPPSRGSDPPSSGNDPPSSYSDSPSSGSYPPSSGRVPQPSYSDPQSSDSPSTASGSDPPSRYNGSAGRPKEIEPYSAKAQS